MKLQQAMLPLMLLLILLVAGCGSTGNEAGSQAAQIKTDMFTSPLNSATAASISIDAPFETVVIGPLAEPDNLIEAEVEYIGDMVFNVDGDQVTLRESTGAQTYDGDKPLRWNVLVNPTVALALDLSIASGDMTLDASTLNITGLTLNSASGALDVDLPAMTEAIAAEIDVAAGEVSVTMPDGAMVDFSQVAASSGTVNLTIGAAATVTIADVNIASGRVVVDVPTGAALRLEVQDVASGAVNIAYSLTRLTGTGSDEGIWETEGFAEADHQITIVVTSIASGTFELE